MSAALVVALDAGSRARVAALACLPEVRADHVTLAHGVAPERFEPSWIPGGARVGEEVELLGVALAADARVQALRVEIAGSARRPHDGGVLHVTVSRALDAHSVESNALLAREPGLPVSLRLRGRVAWHESPRGA